MSTDATADRVLTVRGRETIAPEAMREVMRSFATGITVVTARHGAADFGMTVNSLTSVSLDPPLVLVCLARGTRTLHAVRASGRFAVTILSADQGHISTRFARPVADRFRDVPVVRDAAGLAVVAAGLAYLRCDVTDIHDGGDHEIVVGGVHDAGTRNGRALVFYDGRYTDLADDD